MRCMKALFTQLCLRCLPVALGKASKVVDTVNGVHQDGAMHPNQVAENFGQVDVRDLEHVGNNPVKIKQDDTLVQVVSCCEELDLCHKVINAILSSAK